MERMYGCGEAAGKINKKGAGRSSYGCFLKVRFTICPREIQGVSFKRFLSSQLWDGGLFGETSRSGCVWSYQSKSYEYSRDN